MRRHIVAGLVVSTVGLLGFPAITRAANNPNFQLSIVDEQCYVDLVIGGGTPYIFIQPEDCEIPEEGPSDSGTSAPSPVGTSPVPGFTTFNPFLTGGETPDITVPSGDNRLPDPITGEEDTPSQPTPKEEKRGGIPPAVVVVVATLVLGSAVVAIFAFVPGWRQLLIRALRALSLRR